MGTRDEIFSRHQKLGFLTRVRLADEKF